VALQLRKKGIEHVHPMAGGFHSWRDKGYPLVDFYPNLAEQIAL